jgi:N-acetylglucosaminyldiphosphoundecaprenol N-acetyl-beta-D-mannosaminyltransferase
VPVYNRIAALPGIRLKVFYAARSEPDRQWDLPEFAHDHVFLPGRMVDRNGRYIHTNLAVWGELARFKPDVVLTTGYNPTHLMAWAYAVLHRCRHVVMTDGTDRSEAGLSRLHRVVRRVVVTSTAAFVAASRGGQRLLNSQGVADDQIHFSPLCANTAVSWADSAGGDRDIDLLFSGRLVAMKNAGFALQLAHGVALQLGRPVRLALLGSGPLEAALRLQAAELAPQVEAVFAGHVSQAEIPSWFQRAKLFVFPTRWDPWGVVANEACLAGVPVLVSPHAGVAGELVRDGLNGRVLPLDLPAWVEAASALLTDPTALAALSQQALRSVQPYSFDNAAAGIVDAARHAALGQRPMHGLSRFIDETSIPDPTVPPTQWPGTSRVVLPVLGVPIDVVTDHEAAARIAQWAQRQESRVVCICNAHSVVTAGRDASFMRVLAQADMATADGEPVAWMLRRLGAVRQRRVSGPELMIDCCAAAAASSEAIFLYGATERTLALLRASLQQRWPALRIAGAIAPPFRALNTEEDDEIVHRINASGAGIVWVGLGCPKQEHWMLAHRGRIHAVMVGVGAAFDFHAGTVRRAPRWMREHGLEWLHRLASEPRRLGRRYVTTNVVFIARATRQLLLRRAESGAPQARI